MRHLTIRNVPADLGERLLEEKLIRGRSLNQTVLDLLSQAVGLSSRSRSNDVRAYAGTWITEEHAEFERAIADTEEIDAHFALVDRIGVVVLEPGSPD